ncbi:MAG: YidC/Oxa1 family membrane protein insertase [Patescibacteria group bacterium]
MGKKILQNVLTFIVIFLVLNLVFSFFIEKENPEVKTGELAIIIGDKEYSRGAVMAADIINRTTQDIAIANECPGEPLNIYKYTNGNWIQKTANPKLTCDNVKETILKAGETLTVTYENWNYALFNEEGRYKIEGKFKIGTEEKTITSSEFEITPQGFWGFIWEKGFYQPIYNVLIFFVGVIPGHNLGFAIILLTIFIRILLLAPSQKALKSQRRMQELQPKLNEIKDRHGDDKQKVSEETMKLWKEHKVNPFGSCLPLLIQFPILIALFYVVQSGLNPDNTHLLYKGFVDVSLSDIDTMFTPFLNLTQREIFWLPLVVGVLQFIQMKMTMVKKKPGEKKSETEVVSNTMLYLMPVMIAVFTASVPSGVGLYWLTSTLFGIVQQYFVNKSVKPKQPVTIDV